MEFCIIFSLQYSIIFSLQYINTFEVDPPSDSLHKLCSSETQEYQRISESWLTPNSAQYNYSPIHELLFKKPEQVVFQNNKKSLEKLRKLFCFSGLSVRDLNGTEDNMAAVASILP
jgi:hypothetical protein